MSDDICGLRLSRNVIGLNKMLAEKMIRENGRRTRIVKVYTAKHDKHCPACRGVSKHEKDTSFLRRLINSFVPVEQEDYHFNTLSSLEDEKNIINLVIRQVIEDEKTMAVSYEAVIDAYAS